MKNKQKTMLVKWFEQMTWREAKVAGRQPQTGIVVRTAIKAGVLSQQEIDKITRAVLSGIPKR
jgi:hypothetical protein